jgi:hypothetical protein
MLIYPDEMEIHCLPVFPQTSGQIGRQPEIPALGQNQKNVVYSGVDYKTGKLTYTMSDAKLGTEFLAFLIVPVVRYACRRVLLVCDTDRSHTTKAVQLWLAEHCDQLLC